jgi:putative (di)nucleoside polyphosphate hydrolase
MFRKGVVVVIINYSDQILLLKRKNQNVWQFVQGGIENDSPLVAMVREVKEEIGINIQASDIILDTYPKWIPYFLPRNITDSDKFKSNIGQKHIYYLVRWNGLISDLDFSEADEFDEAEWVNIDADIFSRIPYYKVDAYREGLFTLLGGYID